MCTQKYLHYSQGFLYRLIRYPEGLYAMLQSTADVAASSPFVAADFYKSFPHRVVQNTDSATVTERQYCSSGSGPSTSYFHLPISFPNVCFTGIP